MINSSCGEELRPPATSFIQHQLHLVSEQTLKVDSSPQLNQLNWHLVEQSQVILTKISPNSRWHVCCLSSVSPHPQQGVSENKYFCLCYSTAVSPSPNSTYIPGAQEVFVEWMHEWMNWLQFCRQDIELSWELPQLLTFVQHCCLSKQIGLDSTEQPVPTLTCLPWSPEILLSTSGYISWVAGTSSFQDCCGKSNALGNFWDWHIRPHLVSRNENSDQGRGRSKERTENSIPFICLPPDAPQIPRLSPSPNFLAVRQY